jgi:predicted dehydrogenase
MGQNHLRILSILKGVELAFVFDTDSDVSQRLAKQYGTSTSTQLDDVIHLAEAVIICTPTVTHADYIRAVSHHVSKIFVEKPLANSLEEARRLAEFTSDRSLQVQVGFIERFNPAVKQLKAVLDASARIINVDFLRTNKISSRITDVDVITDLMVHDIDLALHINGPVRSVTANGVARGQMIDFASATLTHENGRFSRILASRISEKKIRSIQATCSDMYVDCELLRKELQVHRQSELEHEIGSPYKISAVEQTIEVQPQEPLLMELQAFAAMCRGSESEAPNELDGLRAAEVCDRIQRQIAP